MLPRIVTALVGLPVLIGIVWVGGYVLTVLVCIVSAIAAWELSRMSDSWGQRPLYIPAVVLSAALAASGYFLAISNGAVAFSVLISAVALGAAIVLMLFGHYCGSFAVSILVTACIALFIGGALFNAAFLAGHSDGRDFILFLLAVTFATDTGAYAVGRAIGSRKLAPSISPGKTWEGAIGGFLAAIAAGVAFAFILGDGPQWPAAAAILGVTGQAGDLYASKLKRRAGFNDSGAIFPGHGGMLDRLDSLSFNLVALGLAGVALY